MGGLPLNQSAGKPAPLSRVCSLASRAFCFDLELFAVQLDFDDHLIALMCLAVEHRIY